MKNLILLSIMTFIATISFQANAMDCSEIVTGINPSKSKLTLHQIQEKFESSCKGGLASAGDKVKECCKGYTTSPDPVDNSVGKAKHCGEGRTVTKGGDTSNSSDTKTGKATGGCDTGFTYNAATKKCE